MILVGCCSQGMGVETRWLRSGSGVGVVLGGVCIWGMCRLGLVLGVSLGCLNLPWRAHLGVARGGGAARHVVGLEADGEPSPAVGCLGLCAPIAATAFGAQSQPASSAGLTLGSKRRECSW